MSKENFNFITNILLIFILVFGGFVWADTNGVWHRAEDIIPGIFGDDENNDDFVFTNDVIFTGVLKEGLIYEIDINGTTKLNDLRSSEFNTNLANINGDLIVDNSLILEGITCGVNEKLTSDVTGIVSCVVDDVGIDTLDDLSNNKIGDLSNVPVSCSNGQVLKYSSGNWICSNDIDTVGITSESDPQVGILEVGKWCVADGAKINCNQNQPSVSTSNNVYKIDTGCSYGGTLTTATSCATRHWDDGSESGHEVYATCVYGSAGYHICNNLYIGKLVS